MLIVEINPTRGFSNVRHSFSSLGFKLIRIMTGCFPTTLLSIIDAKSLSFISSITLLTLQVVFLLNVLDSRSDMYGSTTFLKVAAGINLALINGIEETIVLFRILIHKSVIKGTTRHTSISTATKAKTSDSVCY